MSPASGPPLGPDAPLSSVPCRRSPQCPWSHMASGACRPLTPLSSPCCRSAPEFLPTLGAPIQDKHVGVPCRRNDEEFPGSVAQRAWRSAQGRPGRRATGDSRVTQPGGWPGAQDPIRTAGGPGKVEAGLPTLRPRPNPETPPSGDSVLGSAARLPASSSRPGPSARSARPEGPAQLLGRNVLRPLPASRRGGCWRTTDQTPCRKAAPRAELPSSRAGGSGQADHTSRSERTEISGPVPCPAGHVVSPVSRGYIQRVGRLTRGPI